MLCISITDWKAVKKNSSLWGSDNRLQGFCLGCITDSMHHTTPRNTHTTCVLGPLRSHHMLFGGCCHCKWGWADDWARACIKNVAMTQSDMSWVWLISQLVCTKLLVNGQPLTLNGFYLDFDQVPQTTHECVDYYYNHRHHHHHGVVCSVMFYTWKWTITHLHQLLLKCSVSPKVPIWTLSTCSCQTLIQSSLVGPVGISLLSLAVVMSCTAILVNIIPIRDHATPQCYLLSYSEDETHKMSHIMVPGLTSESVHVLIKFSQQDYWSGCLEEG